jgi:hypothetical protein
MLMLGGWKLFKLPPEARIVCSSELIAAARASDGTTRVVSLLVDSPLAGRELVEDGDAVTGVPETAATGDGVDCDASVAASPSEEATMMAAINTTIPACMSGLESLIGSLCTRIQYLMLCS